MEEIPQHVRKHYNGVIMTAMASQITSLTIVYSTVYSGADHRKHQSSVSLAFVRGIHRWPVNSPHKGPVTRKMFPFDDVIMKLFAVNKQACLFLSVSYRVEDIPVNTLRPGEVSVNWIVIGSAGVGVTKAPFVNFTVSKTFDLAEVPVRLFVSHSYLTGELRQHLSNMNMIFNR